jgi:hypothetical protein
MRDTEKILTDQLDPVLYKNLKMIIKREMKQELQQLRNDSLGCTDKCRVRNKLVETELERNQKIVEILMNFQWCNECSNMEGGAVKQPCKNGCGRKLMNQCLPATQAYSKQE